ncbi:MAG: hypothetical protein DRP11_02750 [Candidatus Aenigmatarchaeota archaeon]|nr:MAG: hypothetical protein DRP11_02750 [Candidatus Aenigmarchaeota archaeon]
MVDLAKHYLIEKLIFLIFVALLMPIIWLSIPFTGYGIYLNIQDLCANQRANFFANVVILLLMIVILLLSIAPVMNTIFPNSGFFFTLKYIGEVLGSSLPSFEFNY